MSETEARPRAITVACWLLIAGAVVLLAGGLIAATVTFDALRSAAPATVSDDTLRRYAHLYSGAGILFSIAAVALMLLALRARGRDPRFRRAALALSLAIVVLVVLAAVFSGTHILALLSLLPIIAGIVVLNRPSSVDWYAGG